MTNFIQITTEGVFTVEELEMLTRCIRDIEQNDPKRHIEVFMDVPEKSLDECRKMNSSICPGLPLKYERFFTEKEKEMHRKLRENE